jgi:hypothetical protein
MHPHRGVDSGPHPTIAGAQPARGTTKKRADAAPRSRLRAHAATLALDEDPKYAGRVVPTRELLRRQSGRGKEEEEEEEGEEGSDEVESLGHDDEEEGSDDDATYGRPMPGDADDEKLDSEDGDGTGNDSGEDEEHDDGADDDGDDDYSDAPETAGLRGERGVAVERPSAAGATAIGKRHRASSDAAAAGAVTDDIDAELRRLESSDAALMASYRHSAAEDAIRGRAVQQQLVRGAASPWTGPAHASVFVWGREGKVAASHLACSPPRRPITTASLADRTSPSLPPLRSEHSLQLMADALLESRILLQKPLAAAARLPPAPVLDGLEPAAPGLPAARTAAVAELKSLRAGCSACARRGWRASLRCARR